MTTYLTHPGNSDGEFAIMPVTDAGHTRVGFRITRVADSAVSGADVRWEYESAASDHLRSAPYADRRVVDFEPSGEFVHWFPFQPQEGQL